MSLKPWREVILPHEDVLEGTFREADFAADLTKVVLGKAQPEYQDPVRFFERTLITEGMSVLLQSVVRRLSGTGGDPVVQLKTAFGGGKTHTMMAVLHVASGKAKADQMPGVAELLKKAKVKTLVAAKVAVLDGNALSPSQPRVHGKVSANTLWGELAFQLGGAAGYQLVAAADRDGTSPGKDALTAVLEAAGPAVVLIDEAVAYLRQFAAGKSYTGGTYNSNLSFFQALTEAASAVPTAMVLASLPESAMEVGDHLGQQALDSLQKIFGRIEAVWKPVGSEEAFEIVRRRLFGVIQDEAARDQVCEGFSALYTNEPDKFPAEAREGRYGRRMQATYPIHPEVFERLYEDWSTLPKFQRTRGVLRLMARLVHSLWRSDNRDLMILPGSIPLDDIQVRNEFVSNLPAGWDPIIDKEIDGPNAQPRLIDDMIPAVGALQACRRAARAIFIGSAPSVGGQKVRGIGVERVRLGCAQPGQSPGKYDDGLHRISQKLHYLYSGNDRFWFDLRPNLRREMEDRMQRFELRGHIYEDIRDRLKGLVKSSLFSAVHVFADAKDIPDKVDLRLVVLDPSHVHKPRDAGSLAVKHATDILTKHGDKPREYQNRVLFLAPEAGAATQSLLDNVRQCLAWRAIVDEREALDLTPLHAKEAEKNFKEADKRVEGTLRESYRQLLAPAQEIEESGLPGPVFWEEENLRLGEKSYEKAILDAVKDRVWVIPAWGPSHLRDLLQRWFFRGDKTRVGAQRVFADMCRSIYMDRLGSSDVFVQTVQEAVRTEDWFAYASSEKEGEVEGLLFGSTGTVYLDDRALLIEKKDAAAILAARAPKPQMNTGAGESTGGSDTPPDSKRPTRKRTPSPIPAARLRTRFHGSISIDPKDAIGDFAKVIEEVIEHLNTYGTKLRLILDVEAERPEGFEAKTVSVVKQNADVLKFKTAEFEDD